MDKNQTKTCGRGRENSETKFPGPRRAQNTFSGLKTTYFVNFFPKNQFLLKYNMLKYPYVSYLPEGRAERTRWGILDTLSNLIYVWETKMELSKTRARIDLSWNLKNLNCPGGCVGGWMVIKRVLRFSSFSSMLTSKMRWFQIWPQKLYTTNTSKVMSNLSLKIWNFKANFRSGNQLKITMVKKDLSSRCKLRKFFNFFF